MTGVIELFMEYDPDVVLKAISPVWGIPGKFKFLPALAEIKGVLDELSEPARREQARQARLLPPEPPIDRSKRKTYRELVEMCAEKGLEIGPKRRKKWGKDEVKDFKEKFQITEGQWDSIPNSER